MIERRVELLRKRGAGETPVTSIELFFDLVYALAVTQLTEHLLHDLTPWGAARSLLLLLAVWWSWNYTAWFTNYFDPEATPVRLVLLGLMLASLAMSGSLPDAFGRSGLVFAGGYVAIQIVRTVFAVAVLRRDALGPIFQRALVWWSATSLLWLAGGFVQGDARLGLWTAAMAVDVAGVLIGFPAPGLGRSRTRDYPISGGHMAERCRLFVLIALGESILITGQHVAQIWGAPAAVAAFVVAFASSVALWAIYFDRDAEAGRRAITEASDPGRLGVSAFSFFHLPIVAGVAVAAAADELTITHPEAAVSLASAGLILGGPGLFLAGSALYGRAVSGKAPALRVAGLLALVLLAPIALALSQLALLTLATVVVVAVAGGDALVLRAAPRH